MAIEVENTFVITIKTEGEAHHIAAHSGIGVVEPLPFPTSHELLSEEQRTLLQSLGCETANASSAEIQAIGETLYKALFPTPIAVAFGESKGKSNAGTRLCLQVEPAELAALPWEALHDGRDWLALNPTAPLVRRLSLRDEVKVLNNLQVRGAVRILFVGASPEDQPKLEIEAALQSLQERLQEPIAKKKIILDSLLNPTLDQLREQLLKDYHILYFSGHGSPQGIFVNDGYDGSQVVSAATLAQALEGKTTRLVYLAACNTSAQANGKEGLLLESFAQELAARASLPAIVAMQYYLSNMNANTMSGHFFAALAQFRPVDVALAEARSAAMVDDAVGRDVLAPVMYLQADNAALFQKARNWPFLVSLLGLILASMIGGYFWWQRNTEQIEKEWEAAVALSLQLAEESKAAFTKQNPELGLLLAVESINPTRRLRGTVTSQAETALYQAVASPFRGHQAMPLSEAAVKTFARVSTPSHLWDIVTEWTSDLDAEEWSTYAGLVATYPFAETVSMVSFNPDETKFVTVDSYGSAYLWRIGDAPGYVQLDGHKGEVTYASFNEDGSLVFTLSDGGSAQLWDENGNLQAHIEGVVSGVLRANISSDRKYLTTISADGLARSWAFEGELLHYCCANGSIISADYSPDGSTIAFAGSGVPYPSIYDLKSDHTGAGDLAFRNRINQAIVSPDGAKILTTHNGNKVALWNLTGKLQYDFAIGNTNIDNVIRSAGFDHTGVRLVTTRADNTIQIWDVQDKKQLVAVPYDKTIMDVSFSADDASIVTADVDGVVSIWDTKDGKLLKSLVDVGAAKIIRFDDNGNRIFTVGNDGTVSLWNAQDGSLILRLNALARDIQSIDFNTAGDQLVTGGDDGLVRLWSATRGTLLTSYFGFGDAINVVQFSPDDQRVLAAGDNGGVREWRVWHDLDALIAEANKRAGRTFTDDECKQYLKLDQCPPP